MAPTRTRSVTRLTVGVAALAVGTVVSGCATPAGRGLPRPAGVGSSTEGAPQIPSPSSVPIAALPDLVDPSPNSQLKQVRGVLLLSRNGEGSTRLTMSSRFRPGGTVLVRLVCAGASTFVLDEADTGKLISRGGCNPGAVIGVQFKARAADAHLRLTLPTSATWRVAAWRL